MVPPLLTCLKTLLISNFGFSLANICYGCLLCSLAVPHVVAELLKENVALDVSYGPATSITVRYVQLSLCVLMHVDSCAVQ